LSVNENSGGGTYVFTAASGDPEGSGITYSLSDSSGGAFGINGSNGQVYVAGGLDYEATQSRNILVRATDSSGLYTERWFTIGIANVNEAPTSISGSLSVNENSAVNTVVGNVSASDPDNNVSSYSLVSGSDPAFGITSGGQVYLTGGVDYEAGATRQIRVRATDAGGLTYDQTLNVTINNINESPYISDQSFHISETTSGSGQVPIYTVVAGDPETPAANLRYSISGADAGMFLLDANTGVIKLNGPVDYETRTSYSAQITVWDGGAAGTGLSATANLTMYIDNVAEGATFTNGALTGTGRNGDGPVDVIQAASIVDGSAATISVLSISGSTVKRQGTITSIYQTGPYVARLKSVDNYGRVSWITANRSAAGNGSTAGFSFSDFVSPIVLDLNNDGKIDLTAVSASSVRFDMDSDGRKDAAGWVGAGDGLLVLDRNRNGRIDSGAEIGFAGDLPDATSDLEGLAAYDTNANGLFDSGDARWSEFQVWQDSNQDGVSQSDELHSLDSLGIVSIGLNRQLTGNVDDGGNLITATTMANFSDGREQMVGDVMLSFEHADALTHVRSISPRIGLPRLDDVAEPKIVAADTASSALTDPLAAIDNVDRQASTARRRAQMAESRSIAQKMRDSLAAFADGDGRPPSDMNPSNGTPEPAPSNQAVANDNARGQDLTKARDLMASVDLDAFIGDQKPSAADDNLALDVKYRLRMVEAMASFMPQSGHDNLLTRGQVNPQAMALLTALPLHTNAMA
jgi:hypothetical protein